MFLCHSSSTFNRRTFMASSQLSQSADARCFRETKAILWFSYTSGRGVEGLMRLTVRLKNPDESFEPAVNPIPIPDAPGPKLDYDYSEVSMIWREDWKYFFSDESSSTVVRTSTYRCRRLFRNSVTWPIVNWYSQRPSSIRSGMKRPTRRFSPRFTCQNIESNFSIVSQASSNHKCSTQHM